MNARAIGTVRKVRDGRWRAAGWGYASPGARRPTLTAHR